MAFHTDGIAKADVAQSNTGSVVAPVGLFALTATALTFGSPAIGLVTAMAAIVSLSSTFVGLVQSSDKVVGGSHQLDLVYGVITGLLFSVAHGLAFGVFGMAGLTALTATVGLFAVLVIGEALFAALISTCTRFYSAPVAIAISVNYRFFGLLGRAA